MNKRLVNIVECENILSQSQISFRPKKSTTTAVYKLGVTIGIAKQWKLPMILSLIELEAA